MAEVIGCLEGELGAVEVTASEVVSAEVVEPLVEALWLARGFEQAPMMSRDCTGGGGESDLEQEKSNFMRSKIDFKVI